MINYHIAIPSFNRPHKIIKYTLPLIERQIIIPMNVITIFVNDEAQYELYKKAIDENFADAGINIHITNCKGIGRNRQYIRNYYPNNSRVVFMDDDIEKVIEKGKPTCELHILFNLGFAYCEEEKATLWGIPLVDNEFYMKNDVSINLKYIGAVYGVILTPAVKEIKIDIDQWEDYLVSVEHFYIDGKVIRLNNYGIKSRWYSPDGGICSAMGGKENRMAMLEESGRALCDKYPRAMSLYYKKDGTPNIRLNHRLSAFVS